MDENSNNNYLTFEELYEAYVDCRKRKRTTINALEFEIEDSRKLFNLWTDLNHMNYEIGKSITFCVERPVKREVFAADFRDRIVHHLLINRINDILEKEFIEDSYSCRKGKGTDYGIRKCQEYLIKAIEGYSENAYIIKCDLKSFFMTIDKEKLKRKLFKFIDENYHKDENDVRFVKYLIELIILHEPQHNCIRKQSVDHWSNLPKEKSLFSCKQGYGLPIGNLTSQIFANFYLSDFDKFIKKQLGLDYYGRYVDDFFIICNDKYEANDVLKQIRKYLSDNGVNLHPKKLYIQHLYKGIQFIGAVVKDNRIYISNRTKGSFYAKICLINNYIKQQYEKGLELTLNEKEHIVGSINSYLGFLIHYKTYNIRKKILMNMELMKEIYKFCHPNTELSKLILFKEHSKYQYSKRKKTKRVSRNQFFRTGMNNVIKRMNSKPINEIATVHYDL